MNDNIATIGIGSITSITTGIINDVTFVEIWKVALFGFIGAVMGYMARILIKYIIKLIKNRNNEQIYKGGNRN